MSYVKAGLEVWSKYLVIRVIVSSYSKLFFYFKIVTEILHINSICYCLFILFQLYVLSFYVDQEYWTSQMTDDNKRQNTHNVLPIDCMYVYSS